MFCLLDADLVCIIGEIEVKVVGKVRTGECIYTCPSDKFPGTATTQRHSGNYLIYGLLFRLTIVVNVTNAQLQEKSSKIEDD